MHYYTNKYALQGNPVSSYLDEVHHRFRGVVVCFILLTAFGLVVNRKKKDRRKWEREEQRKKKDRDHGLLFQAWKLEARNSCNPTIACWVKYTVISCLWHGQNIFLPHNQNTSINKLANVCTILWRYKLGGKYFNVILSYVYCFSC